MNHRLLSVRAHCIYLMYAIMGADLLSLWFVVLSVPIYPCQHSFRTFFFFRFGLC
nr:MAG TPA: hypothetical protein [Caudoviricetes sp.]